MSKKIPWSSAPPRLSHPSGSGKSKGALPAATLVNAAQARRQRVRVLSANAMVQFEDGRQSRFMPGFLFQAKFNRSVLRDHGRVPTIVDVRDGQVDILMNAF